MLVLYAHQVHYTKRTKPLNASRTAAAITRTTLTLDQLVEVHGLRHSGKVVLIVPQVVRL